MTFIYLLIKFFGFFGLAADVSTSDLSWVVSDERRSVPTEMFPNYTNDISPDLLERPR